MSLLLSKKIFVTLLLVGLVVFNATYAVSACLGEYLGIFGPDRRTIALEKRQSLLASLGTRWVRINAAIPLDNLPRTTSVDDMPAYEMARQKVMLSVHNPRLISGAEDAGDLARFKIDLQDVVRRLRPAMIAVENEVDNPPYAMSAEVYLAQLKVSCEVAHANGLLCTDSGITTKMALALLADDALTHGQPKLANEAAHSVGVWRGRRIAPARAGLRADLDAMGVARAAAIIDGLSDAGADHVNLHWYTLARTELTGEMRLLTAVVSMLKTRTGLPVVAGEVGIQAPRTDDRNVPPDLIVTTVHTLLASAVEPIILWNPGRGLFPAAPAAMSLIDADAVLLPSGQALAQLVAESCR